MIFVLAFVLAFVLLVMEDCPARYVIAVGIELAVVIA
jgi:hypothetical protein